jgi:hypothetical protein
MLKERSRMVRPNQLTLTQQAMFDILSDGRFHSRWELHRCLPDDMGGIENIKAHLTAIRKVLEPQSITIRNTTQNRCKGYVMVRFLHAND